MYVCYVCILCFVMHGCILCMCAGTVCYDTLCTYVISRANDMLCVHVCVLCAYAMLGKNVLVVCEYIM